MSVSESSKSSSSEATTLLRPPAVDGGAPPEVPGRGVSERTRPPKGSASSETCANKSIGLTGEESFGAADAAGSSNRFVGEPPLVGDEGSRKPEAEPAPAGSSSPLSAIPSRESEDKGSSAIP